MLLLAAAAAVAAPAPAAGQAPLLAAHRGGAGLWPENSLRAFRGALALGVDLVELDVHLTRDGHLVVIHDPTLERTTSGIGEVRAATLGEIQEYRLRGPDGRLTGERVPRLDEVLALVAGTRAGLLLEIKTARRGARYEGIEARVLDRLRARGLAARSVVMAFEPAVVRRVRALDPVIRTGLLVSPRRLERAGAAPADALGWAAAAGATDLGLQHTLLTPALLAAARARSLRVGAWTVNDEADLRRVIDLGVDIVISDRPDRARRLLGRGAGRR